MPRDRSEGHHLSVSLTVSRDLQDSFQRAAVSSLALQTCVPSSNLGSGSEDNPTKGLTPEFYRLGGSKVYWVDFGFLCFVLNLCLFGGGFLLQVFCVAQVGVKLFASASKFPSIRNTDVSNHIPG